MLEDRSYLVSPGYPRACERGNSWDCMTFQLEHGKPQIEINVEEEHGERKLTKQSEVCERADPNLISNDLSMSLADYSNKSCDPHQAGDNSDSESDRVNKRPLEINIDDEFIVRKSLKPSDVQKRVDPCPILNEVSVSLTEETGSQHQTGDNSDSDFPINGVARDGFIRCLMHCSRVDYGSIASLNRSFRFLVRSGELYRMRQVNGIIEHWVYISCNLLEWEAFDPNSQRWMRLPMMPSNERYFISDKESLAVGTELLVFAKEMMVNVIYRYSLLTNSWSSGMRMNAPRCLFGSASLGEVAIVAGGCESAGKALNTAELYNSETGDWHRLPTMNKARKMCSGVFMDGKFYVIGGVGGSDMKLLTCGEEYNLATRTWTEIPNMSPVRSDDRENEVPATSEAPPLVAVVDNQLYAADHAQMEVRRYDKERRVWLTVGRLPERVASMNGWGLAFRACGNRLICIGGPRTAGEGFIEVNSWVPSEGPPEWNLLGRKQFASFVYNCAVMGC